MSSSLEEKVNGRLLANVHGRGTRGHSATWLLSVPVRQTFGFAGRAGILIDLSNTLKPKTFGLKTFGQNISDKKLSDCFLIVSDKTTFGQAKFSDKRHLDRITKEVNETKRR